jgi:putative ABC transport system permease protein
MIIIHRLRSLARWLFRRHEVERQLHDELESFIELSTNARMREGATPEEARRLARLELGGVEQTKERVRTYRWGALLEQGWQDLRYARRSLASQPAFTAIVVVTLAIGIGANTAIYTVVDSTMLRSLPFRDPDRLMRVSLTSEPEPDGRPGREDMIWSYPKYKTFRENQQVFEDTAIYRAITLNLTGTGEAERLRTEEVGAGYFPILGVSAEVGRTFLPEEDVTPGKDLVAVISYGLWHRQFGGERTIIGKTISLDLQSFTVVGVLPPHFQGLAGPADVWVPIHRQSAESLDQPWGHAWQFVARLKPDVSIEQARSAVLVVGRIVDETYPPPNGGVKWSARATALNDNRLDPAIRESVLILFGAVIFVVLIACVNVANLLLARGSGRQREIAIRCAIGAGRGRVMRQLLTESLLLAVLGGAASLAVAYASVYFLSTLNPAVNTFVFGGGLPGLTLLGFSSIRLDSSALIFTFVTALLAGLLFGLAPAWHAARTDLTGALKKSADRSFAFNFVSAKSILVILEVALALVLLAGAGLMIKSVARLSATHIGVDADNVLTARLSLPPGERNFADSIHFFTALQQRMSTQPGVIDAAIGSCHALASGCGSTIIWFRDRAEVPRGTEPGIGVLRVSPEYFKTMKIPLVRGRLFTTADREDAPKVAIINETAAQQYWPGQDPIGKPIGIGINGFADRVEVIGVVGDVRYGRMEQLPQPDAYVSYLQGPATNMFLFARTTGDPAALIPSVRRHVQAINSDLPIYDVKTMRERIGDATARMRFNAILLGIFAAIAIVLSAVGVFGVMSYLVRQSTREIGIRMALGARAEDVVRDAMRRAAGLVFAGTIIGLVGSLAATRVLATSLYEVTPADPHTYVVISAVLGLVAMLASYIPARRASLVDPSITLRSDG